MRWCLDPRRIAAMSFNDFLRRVTTRDRGLRQVRRLRSIYEAAGVSVGCPMGKAAQFEARQLADRIAAKAEQLDRVMKRLEKVCRRFSSYQHLRSIPGFGPFVAAVVLAAIGPSYPTYEFFKHFHLLHVLHERPGNVGMFLQLFILFPSAFNLPRFPAFYLPSFKTSHLHSFLAFIRLPFINS